MPKQRDSPLDDGQIDAVVRYLRQMEREMAIITKALHTKAFHERRIDAPTRPRETYGGQPRAVVASVVCR